MSILDTPSKSNGGKNGVPNRPMGAKRRKQSISTGSLLHSWNNLALETLPEALLVTLFIFVEGFSHIPGLLLKDVQWLLASLLILNSGIRTNRQTPETMQRSCKTFLKKNRARNLQRACRELARNLQHMQRPFPKAKSETAYSILRRLSILGTILGTIFGGGISTRTPWLHEPSLLHRVYMHTPSCRAFPMFFLFFYPLRRVLASHISCTAIA